MAVTIQDLLNDPRYKDNKSLILLAKPGIVPPHKPRKKKKQKPPKYFLDFVDEMREFIRQQKAFNLAITQRLDKLDKIVKLNNLKTE